MTTAPVINDTGKKRGKLLRYHFLCFGIALVVAIPAGYLMGKRQGGLEELKVRLAPFHDVSPKPTALPSSHLPADLAELMMPLGHVEVSQATYNSQRLWTSVSPLPELANTEAILWDLVDFWSFYGLAAGVHGTQVIAFGMDGDTMLTGEVTAEGELRIACFQGGDHANEAASELFLLAGLPLPPPGSAVSSAPQDDGNMALLFSVPGEPADIAYEYRERLRHAGWTSTEHLGRSSQFAGALHAVYTKDGSFLSVRADAAEVPGNATLALVVF